MEALASKGWAITFAHEKRRLPASLLQRYDWLPDDLILLACSVDLAVSPEEITWFLSWEDYHGTSDSHYRWNEWELFSLETAKDKNDPEAAEEIAGYWDDHFPFLLTTGGKLGYGYAAIRKSDHSIVFGFEPAFQDPVLLAGSLEKFLQKLVEMPGWDLCDMYVP